MNDLFTHLISLGEAGGKNMEKNIFQKKIRCKKFFEGGGIRTPSDPLEFVLQKFSSKIRESDHVFCRNHQKIPKLNLTFLNSSFSQLISPKIYDRNSIITRNKCGITKFRSCLYRLSPRKLGETFDI